MCGSLSKLGVMWRYVTPIVENQMEKEIDMKWELGLHEGFEKKLATAHLLASSGLGLAVSSRTC